MVSRGTPWRFVASGLERLMPQDTARTVVGLLALVVAAAWLRRPGLYRALPPTSERPAAAAAASRPRWPGSCVAPYSLPWYDAVAWALLRAGGRSTGRRPGAARRRVDGCWTAPAAHACCRWPTCPGRVVGLTDGIETAQDVVRGALAPAVVLVVAVGLAGSGRRAPAGAYLRVSGPFVALVGHGTSGAAGSTAGPPRSAPSDGRGSPGRRPAAAPFGSGVGHRARTARSSVTDSQSRSVRSSSSAVLVPADRLPRRVRPSPARSRAAAAHGDSRDDPEGVARGRQPARVRTHREVCTAAGEAMRHTTGASSTALWRTVSGNIDSRCNTRTRSSPFAFGQVDGQSRPRKGSAWSSSAPKRSSPGEHRRSSSAPAPWTSWGGTCCSWASNASC